VQNKHVNNFLEPDGEPRFKLCSRNQCFFCRNFDESSFNEHKNISIKYNNLSKNTLITYFKTKFSCDTVEGIYSVSCSECDAHYVGETKNSFRTRFYNHSCCLSHSNIGKTLKPLYAHFSRHSGNLSTHVCTGKPMTGILALGVWDIVGERQEIETQCMKALGSIWPYGLNDKVTVNNKSMLSNIDTVNVFDMLRSSAFFDKLTNAPGHVSVDRVRGPHSGKLHLTISHEEWRMTERKEILPKLKHWVFNTPNSIIKSTGRHLLPPEFDSAFSIAFTDLILFNPRLPPRKGKHRKTVSHSSSILPINPWKGSNSKKR
jgi:hypothetical protein